jgi:outer membrane protein
MRRGLFGRALLLGTAALLLVRAPDLAHAETISEALASAYASNPTLQAERARQRATDEGVPQALSGWRPTVSASADGGWERSNAKSSPITRTNPADVTIALEQPVFRGFRTVSGTKAAEATVRAGRQSLLAVEQQVLFDGVAAYMNVIRDRDIVLQRKRNAGILGEEHKATKARFKAGEINRTDVALARARASQAQADLSTARADLAASAADYERVIGHPPGKLMMPQPWRLLPPSVEAAQEAARHLNPELLTALHIEEASRYNVDIVQGQLLPEVSLQASYAASRDPLDDVSSSNTTFLGGAVTMPLYESGSIYSQVREAKQVASQRRLQILESARQIRDLVTTAWNTLEAARVAAIAIRDQVSANELAVQGVKEEQRVGAGPLIRVLDAERDLVESRVALSRTSRDGVVAAYQLIAATGGLTAENLALPVKLYDPTDYYRSVRNRWIGTNADTIE